MKGILGKSIRLKLIEDKDIKFMVELINSHKYKTNLNSIMLTYGRQKV